MVKVKIQGTSQTIGISILTTASDAKAYLKATIKDGDGNITNNFKWGDKLIITGVAVFYLIKSPNRMMPFKEPVDVSIKINDKEFTTKAPDEKLINSFIPFEINVLPENGFKEETTILVSFADLEIEHNLGIL